MTREWRVSGFEDYSIQIIPTVMSSISDHILYEAAMLMSKDELKITLGMLALKEKFKYRIRMSSKIHFEASCKDISYKFQQHAIGMQKGFYWIIAKFLKDHSCELEFVSFKLIIVLK